MCNHTISPGVPDTEAIDRILGLKVLLLCISVRLWPDYRHYFTGLKLNFVKLIFMNKFRVRTCSKVKRELLFVMLVCCIFVERDESRTKPHLHE